MRPVTILLPCAVLALGCGRRPGPPPPRVEAPAPVVPEPPPDPGHMPSLAGWRVLAEPRLSQAGPHRGLLQRTQANALAAAALDRGATSPWPDGSQLVKESFTRKGEKVAMTGMQKVAGEWIWITADARGRVTGRYKGAASGACEACHYTQAWRFDGSFAPVTAGLAALDGTPPAGAKTP